MAAAPYLTVFISAVFDPAFSVVGADPAMAANTFLVIDMGGYILVAETTQGQGQGRYSAQSTIFWPF